jgi:hypothetical protein
MTNIDNSVMDWNDVIEDDGQEFVLLPEGDYNFVVTNFERGRFPGSAKIPATNKATISIQIFSELGVASMKFDLILSKALTWKLSAFFRSIGQKKRGEKITMDWNKVLGTKGRAHIKQKVYTNQAGEEKTINDLDYFIDYDEKYFSEVVDDKDLPF